MNGVAKIGADLARGLSMLHRLNIVHRDIKPDNIHIGADQRLRILDLGVALNTTVGTPDSMENPGTPRDRKSTRLNSSHLARSRMPSSA